MPGREALPGTVAWFQGVLLGAALACVTFVLAGVVCGVGCGHDRILGVQLMTALGVGSAVGSAWFLWRCRGFSTWNPLSLDSTGLLLMGVSARLVGVVSVACLVVAAVLVWSAGTVAPSVAQSALKWLLMGTLGTCQLIRVDARA